MSWGSAGLLCWREWRGPAWKAWICVSGWDEAGGRVQDQPMVIQEVVASGLMAFWSGATLF